MCSCVKGDNNMASSVRRNLTGQVKHIPPSAATTTSSQKVSNEVPDNSSQRTCMFSRRESRRDGEGKGKGIGVYLCLMFFG
jgi:hypothetical protein